MKRAITFLCVFIGGSGATVAGVASLVPGGPEVLAAVATGKDAAERGVEAVHGVWCSVPRAQREAARARFLLPDGRPKIVVTCPGD